MAEPLDGCCGTCIAYVPTGAHPTFGPAGLCAREMRQFPVLPGHTCAIYRNRNAPAPAKKRPTERSRQPARQGLDVSTNPAPMALPDEIDLDMDIDTFRAVLSEVLRQELGISEVELGKRWQGGELILKPGKEGVAEKRIPIETLFKKIVTIRDKLRVLEQKVNGNTTLTDEEKVGLQQYITGCYGSLTTFNILFAEPKEEGFVGASSKDD